MDLPKVPFDRLLEQFIPHHKYLVYDLLCLKVLWHHQSLNLNNNHCPSNQNLG